MYYLIFLAELIILFLASQLLTRSLSRVFYTVTRNMKITVYLLALLFFPGTLIHELAHYMCAALFQVPVGDMKLFPEIQEDGVKLGSVNIAETDPFRRALIGVAPILAGLGILLLLFYEFFQSLHNLPLWALILGIYVVFEISNTMFSSNKDLEGTLELGGAIIFVLAVLFFIGVRVPRTVGVFFLSTRAIHAVQLGIVYLGIPLGIDIITILLMTGLLKLLRKRSGHHFR